MQHDKRKGGDAIPANLRQVLTASQAKTLDEIGRLGWKLRFVRQPLFMDPVPVVSNASDDQIGVLDPDGKIQIDPEYRLRPDRPAPDAINPGASAATERRRKLSPIPANLEEILNERQMQSLKQIENFGWQLLFVRRPLFQDPLVVIVSAEGDRFGTLERDGRIEIHNRFELRESSRGKQDDSAAGPRSGK